MINIATGASSVLQFVHGAFSAWRYLLSPKYREQVNSRWKQGTQMQMMADVIGSVICAVGTIVLIAMLICFGLRIGWFVERSPNT